MMLEYLYWISFYCTWGGRWLCWIHCSYDKSSKDKVLRFKWETPLLVFVCFLVTMFSHCRKCQVFMCYILYVVYIDYTRQFRLILLYVFILKIFFCPLWGSIATFMLFLMEARKWPNVVKGYQASQKCSITINKYYC